MFEGHGSKQSFNDKGGGEIVKTEQDINTFCGLNLYKFVCGKWNLQYFGFNNLYSIIEFYVGNLFCSAGSPKQKHLKSKRSGKKKYRSQFYIFCEWNLHENLRQRIGRNQLYRLSLLSGKGNANLRIPSLQWLLIKNFEESCADVAG